MDLSQVPLAELEAELQRRRGTETCPKCRKWQATWGAYDRDGYTLRCHGCIRAVASCTCM